MSSRAAARGSAAASSIRLTSRTSKAVATSRASPSRCFLFCRGSRAARSAPIAVATVAIPPIRKPPQARRIPFKHRKVQRARKSDGWQGLSPHPPSNFLARWPCRVIEGRVVDWERLEGGDGRDRDDGGRDWGRLWRALSAAEQEAARRFGSPCGNRLGRA